MEQIDDIFFNTKKPRRKVLSLDSTFTISLGKARKFQLRLDIFEIPRLGCESETALEDYSRLVKKQEKK